MTGRPNIDALRVRAGEPVTAAKWNGLLMFCDRLLSALSEMVGPGLTADYSADGIFLKAEQQNATFGGVFGVAISGKEAIIGSGMISGIVPAIGEIRLDAATPPRLPLTGSPNEDLRSWVAVKTFMDTTAATPALDAEKTADLQIVHVNSLAAGDLEAGEALLPLALLIWSSETAISRAEQMIYFNQSVRYYPTAKEFVFYAAA